jgi:hypothetical protein
MTAPPGLHLSHCPRGARVACVQAGPRVRKHPKREVPSAPPDEAECAAWLGGEAANGFVGRVFPVWGGGGRQ